MRTPVREVDTLIGIDIGAAYSCVGVWQNDTVQIIPNEVGSRTTPSYVAFTASGRLTGDSAKNQVNTNPKNTVFDIKRLIGRRFSDSSVQKAMKLWPFKVVAGVGDKPRIVVNYKGQEKHLSPEEIIAMIIVKMKEIAEVYIGLKVEFVVCSVPACYNTSQRQAMVDASVIAGISNMRLVNEPSAAVLAYGLPRIAKELTLRKVLVFDLGSGSLNVSVFGIEEGLFEVIASSGKSDIGGGDFVNRMVYYLVQEFERKHQKKIKGDSRAITRLWNSCERAKRTLSTNSDVVIEIDSFFDGIDFFFKVSRVKFEQLNMYLFYDCLESVDKCLQDSSLYTDDLDEIVLVGGSTRIPKVQQLLKEMFNGKELCKSVNQDEAVAYGATVQAAMYSGASSDVISSILLLEVTPLSLGFANNQGFMTILIPKNSTIPYRARKLFIANELLDAERRIKVYEGEEMRAINNNFLGEVDVSWIRDLAMTDEIYLTFDVYANWVFDVCFEEKKNGKVTKVTVTNVVRLSKGEISRMMEESDKFKVDDEKHKEDIDAKNELENLAYNMKKSVEEKVSSSNAFGGAKKRFVLEAVDEVIRF